MIRKIWSRVKDLRRVFRSYGWQNQQLFRAFGWTATNSLDPFHREDLEKSNPPTDLILSESPLPAISTFRLAQAYDCALLKAILYTWLTSLRGTDDLYDATLECARGKCFPVWCKIRNYRFGIFNFDAELEWCKFRALTVWEMSLNACTTYHRLEAAILA